MKKNPIAGIQNEAKIKMIRSMQEVEDTDGRFYVINYTADYMLDSLLTSGAVDLKGMQSFISTHLFDVHHPLSMATGAGCSAFAATDPQTKHFLMCRNYDFNHEDIAAILVYTSPKKGLKSISMVDGGWLGFKKGFATDGKTDLSGVMALPYMVHDGVNEKGFAMGVLQLDGKGTVQNTGKPKISSSIAMRYLLDHVSTVPEAIAILQKYDMVESVEGMGNFHYFMADAQGNYAVVEYVYVQGQSRPNIFCALTKQRCVTNFYVAPAMADTPDGINHSTHGKARYDVLDAVLKCKNNKLSAEDAMDLLKFVSQEFDPKDPTSHTQWSVVYDLTDKTAQLCLLRDYDTIFGFDVVQIK